MSAKPSFKVGLVQMSMSARPDDNLAKAVDKRARGGRTRRRGRVPARDVPHALLLPEGGPRELRARRDRPGAEHRGARRAPRSRRASRWWSPIFERRAPGVYHNSAVILDADGTVAGLYRKMHIPDDPLFYEKFYFAPGDLGFRPSTCGPGRIGTLICWDQWYPEGARLTALRGAAVLFYPTAIGWHPSEKAEHGVLAALGLADDPALARDRQRRLRRGRQPRRPRAPGRRRRRARVLGLELPRRPLRRRDRRGLDRPRGDPGGRGEPRAHRRGADPLAVPARPAHRRLRRHRAPLPRRRVAAWRAPPSTPTCRPSGCRPSGSRTRPPGSAGRTTSPTGRGASPRSRGSTARSCASSPRASACASWCRRSRTRRRRGASWSAWVPSTERVEFFRFPSDRGWTRDFGPICVRREHPKPEVAVARFRFNGWAKYADHRKDDQIAERAAKALGLRLRRAVHKGRPVVLEGGAIDVDGRGTSSPPRSACSTRRAGAQPRLQARRLRAGLPREPGRERT